MQRSPFAHNCHYTAHDALENRRYLQKLVSSLKGDVNAQCLLCTIDLQYVFDVLGQKILSQENLISIQPLVMTKCTSENMAKKITNSGLCNMLL